MTKIKFGTDGWRAEIGKDFTFENLNLVSQAVASYINDRGEAEKGIMIGYDNRFLSEKFALHVAQVLAAKNIKVALSPTSIPTPFVSFAVVENQAAGGIMITASHNPATWNGFKFKASFGGSAPQEITRYFEARVAHLSTPLEVKEESIPSFDISKAYFKHLEKMVDLEAILNSKIKIVVDPMYGSGAGILKELLGERVTEIRGRRDPLFGGVNPEPIKPNLEATINYMQQFSPEELAFCVVLDGDADRIGGVSAGGIYINSHQILTLLLRHLVKDRKMSGEVVKTFNITNMVDKLSAKYGLKLHETPIGFKYACDLMLSGDILIAGEESGGIGIKGHIPERDGILNGLLLLEIVAKNQKNLPDILNEVMAEIGEHYYDRFDFHLKEGLDAKAMLEEIEAGLSDEFTGLKIVRIAKLDGLKLFFENGAWILMRASGTEPLIRIYVEAPTKEQVTVLLEAGQRLFLN